MLQMKYLGYYTGLNFILREMFNSFIYSFIYLFTYSFDSYGTYVMKISERAHTHMCVRACVRAYVCVCKVIDVT